MRVSDQTKKDNKTCVKLKQFYSSSQAYLGRLKRHNEETFSSYIELCKKLISVGASILDCGCGIGTSSYLLAKEGFKVTATDISPLFISEATKKYGHLPNLKFFIEDAFKMSFPDHSFDAVCCYDMLEHVTDVKGVLEEMCRVLKNRGWLIIFMPNHLDPIQHLIACTRWGKKDKYRPWEAKSKIGAFCQFIRTGFLVIAKAVGINKKIYYLEPVLSSDENVCGEDFDATWLTNWFDVENTLKELGISVECICPQNFRSRIIWGMRTLKLPKVLQSFYTKVRTKCVIGGIKK